MNEFRNYFFLLIFFFLSLCALPASAEKLHSWKTKHFLIESSPRWIHHVQWIQKHAENEKKKIEKQLGFSFQGQFTIRIAETGKAYAEIQPHQWNPHSYIAGLAYPHQKLMTLRVRGIDGIQGFYQTFRHELSHLLLYQAVNGKKLPLWFIEGIAKVQSDDYGVFEKFVQLVEAKVSKNLPTLREIELRFPASPSRLEIAYALSCEYILFLQSIQPHFLGSLIQQMRKGKEFQPALLQSIQKKEWELNVLWEDFLDKKFHWFPFFSSSGLFGGGLLLLFLFAFVRAKTVRNEQFAKLEEQEKKDEAFFLQYQNEIWNEPEDNTPQTEEVDSDQSIPFEKTRA